LGCAGGAVARGGGRSLRFRFCDLREIAGEHAFDDARTVLVDETHVRARTNAYLIQQRDGVAAREVQFLGEFVNSNPRRYLLFTRP
jgi:hypothetical protein